MVLTIKHKLRVYRKYEHDIWGIAHTDRRVRQIRRRVYFDYKLYLKFYYSNRFNTADKGWRRPDYHKMLDNPDPLSSLRKFNSPYFRVFYKIYLYRKSLREFNTRRFIYRLDIFPPIKKFRRKNYRFISVRLTRLYYLTFQDHQFRKLFRKASKMTGNMEDNYFGFLEGRLSAVFYRTNWLANIFEIMRFIRDGHVYVNFQPVSNINYRVSLGEFVSFNRKFKHRLYFFLRERLNYGAIIFPPPAYMFMCYGLRFCYIMRPPLWKDLVYTFPLDTQRLTGYY